MVEGRKCFLPETALRCGRLLNRVAISGASIGCENPIAFIRSVVAGLVDADYRYANGFASRFAKLFNLSSEIADDPIDLFNHRL